MENAEAIIKRRHRFKTFTQQIALVNADINTAFELDNSQSDDSISATYFYSTLLSTLQKNFDPLYSELTNDLLPISRTRFLVVNNKDKIFKLILNYIKRPYNEVEGGIENVLKLISQLARDLRQEFYPYFQDIFSSLANIFAPNDAKFIDDFFKCILFLLKFLQKWLIQDIENVINLFVHSYFSKNEEFIRRLSAQCLAFLMRQCQSKKKTHKILLNIVSEFILSEESTEKNDENDNPKENPNQDDYSDSDEEDENDNSKRKHKKYVVDMEEKEMTKREKIIQTLGYLYYYEIKNIQNSLWFNSPELIKPFLQLDEQFVYEAFLQMIERVSKHVTAQRVQDYLNSLAEELPQINAVLTFRTFIILMGDKNQQINNFRPPQPLFLNTEILINVLQSAGKECPIDILCKFLSKLNDFHIYEKDYEAISDIVVFIISNSIKSQKDDTVNILNENTFTDCNYNFDVHFVLNELRDSKKIAEISSEAILSFADDNFSDVLPFLDEIFQWSKPQSKSITDQMIDKANELFLQNRELIVPLFKYLHNESTYKIITSLDDLSLTEYGVLFTLMSEYEPDRLIEQPPQFLEYLLNLDSNSSKDSINSIEALKILYHLIKTCKIFQPDWMKIDSKMFTTLFDKINFNTPDKEAQSVGSSILSLFLDTEKEIIFMNGDELIVLAAESVFNIKENTLKALRNGEAMIEHLATGLHKMRSIDRLFNVSLGFSRCNYIKFREFDAKLIGEIIKFEPQKYGPLVTDELEKTFPWKTDHQTNVHFLERTLFQGIQRAEYINERIVELIVRYCNYESINAENEDEIVKTKVSLLDTLAAISHDPQYNDKVEEIGFDFLKSTNAKIRKSAFNILYNITIAPTRKLNEQQKDKIKQNLEVFINGENNQFLVTFAEFLEKFKFQRPFISKVAVYLSIGTVKEFLSEKKRMKKKFKSLSNRLLQALSYLDTEEVAPLIQSFLVPNPTASDYRRFPKYFIPMISSIPMHLDPFLDEIATFLNESIKQASLNTREMNNSMNACSRFFESYPGYNEFADSCLSVLDKALSSKQQSVIRLTTALSIQFPSLFKQHEEAIEKIIQKLRDNTTPDIINIITRIITEIPKYYDEITETFKKVLENTKLMKRDNIWKSFNLLLTFMKESFATQNFIDLLIIFLVNYRHVETIPIVHGINLTSEQFSELSKLIAYPLDFEFRNELIPLIAEFMSADLAEAFIKLNKDDLSEKTITYRSLDSAGDFSFIFALQSFSDLQLNDFSLRAATVGFLSRVIQHTPSIVFEYILPAIKFHVKKEHSRIPPAEILIILNTIIKEVPDIEQKLPTIKRISEQPFFLSLGSFDAKIREDALNKLTDLINSYDDWNVEEINDIVFPLLTQFATTEGIEKALSSLIKYADDAVIKRLLRRLIRAISHGSTIHLLIALCKSQAFKKEDVAPQLLSIVTDPKKPPAIQLRLIPALLSVDHSNNVIHSIIGSIAPKLPANKEEIRRVGQQSLTELVKTLNPDDYFILFQDLRSFLKQGKQIPILFMSLNNMLANASQPQGSFDKFIQLFSEILLEDIFGLMGTMRSKKAAEIPEAKKCMSYSSFQYLAKYVEFKDTARELIDSILKKFETLKTIDQSKGAKKIILSLSEGFVENETVDATTLVDLISHLLNLSDQIKKDDAKKAQEKERNKSHVVYGQKYEEDFYIEKPTRSETEDGGNEIMKRLGNNYLVSLLAVRLLYIFFKKDLFDTNDKQQVELLESLLQRLWEFIQRAQDTETLVVSLSILEYYIKFPSFAKFLPDVLSFLTRTISKLSNATDDFGKAVFKLLTEVLVTYEKLELPPNFTRALVTFCGAQIGVHDSCDTIFGILKLIMTRRKDIPEIYDIAQPALELVIRAVSPQVRKNAAIFVSQFMSTYKVSQKQFKDLLKTALANLSSPKAASRLSLLIFLKHLIDECPKDILDQYTEFILVYLGARIANETDEKIIKKLRKVIGKKLFEKVSESRFSSMWNLMLKWASSDGKQVRTGLHLLAICVEYQYNAFSNLIESLQQVVEVHVNSENYKVKIAAIELHRQIVIAYHQNEGQVTFELRLLSTDKLIELVNSKETTKVGCELLYWYLSEYFELFNPDEEDLCKISDAMINNVIKYHALYKEASESLYLALSNFNSQSDINAFFDSNKDQIYSIFDDISVSSIEKTIISMMRVFVKMVADDENKDNEDFELILKNVLLFIWNVQEFSAKNEEDDKKKKKSELQEATEKALELIRRSVVADLFTKVWTSIIEEDKERKRKDMIERKVEEELDPEAYKKRVADENERRREQERKKRYLTDGQKATLHPFGLDGKRVEKVPLAPEFQ